MFYKIKNSTEAFIGQFFTPSFISNGRSEEKAHQKVSKMVYGSEKNWIHFKLKLTLLKILIEHYSNPVDWIGGLRFLVGLRRRFLGNHRVKKLAYVDGSYYMGAYTPGWDSKLYRQFIASELQGFKPSGAGAFRLNQVFLAVTKKCALRCDHCYEWDNLNKKDVLKLDSLRQIVARVQEMGTMQIHLTGGEPMLKLENLLVLIEQGRKQSNFWINTSGYKLTDTNAGKLKKAGLTGVFISLDHFLPEEHNNFRKFRDAFYWAQEGARNALNHGLVVTYSICMTREFVSPENIRAYMELAKNTGVHFVQFLEPKAVGHYKNREVALSREQIDLLESCFVEMNFSKEYKEYPIITYHGYYQRRLGCFSAGKKGLYIDTDGDINPCTFCHDKSGNFLDKEIEKNLEAMMQKGCNLF
jgi:MoaA/NifB/PqqE/SkfB family radical SAM enzyme